MGLMCKSPNLLKIDERPSSALPLYKRERTNWHAPSQKLLERPPKLYSSVDSAACANVDANSESLNWINAKTNKESFGYQGGREV